MKKTRILSAILSAFLTLTAIPVTAMPLAAAEAPEMGTELLTGGAWSGAEQMDVGYASAKGVGHNYQYFLTLSESNKLETGKYTLAFRAKKGDEPYSRYLHIYKLKNGRNIEYSIYDANDKINATDTYKLTMVLRGNNGGESLKIKIRNGQITAGTGTNGYSSNVVDVQNGTTGLTTFTLSKEWKTFTIDGIKFTYDKYNNDANGASHVWTILENATGGDICFDVAEFKLVNQNGVDCSTAIAQTRVKSGNTDGWAKNTNNVTDMFAKVLPADYSKFKFAIRNAAARTFTNLNTGVSAQAINLTDDWQTFVTEFEIYPDADKDKSGVDKKLCVTYEGAGSNYNAWLNFFYDDNAGRSTANEKPAIDVDFADFVLVHQPTGTDRLVGAVAKSSATGNSGWEGPNGKATVNSVNMTYNPFGFFSIKTEKHDAFADGITYTYNTPAELTAGMYSFSADLISAKPTEVEAVAVVADADGEEKTVIINSAEGEKYVTTNALKQKYEFVFTAEEGTKLVSVTLRKTEDTASDAKVRFYSASLKQIGAYGDESFEDELYARLDTEFGAAVVTPDEMGRKYLSVHDRASATDGVKIDTSKLGLDTSKQYTVQFNIRTSVEHTDLSKLHKNQTYTRSTVRVRVNNSGNTTVNFDKLWTAVSVNLNGGNSYNIVGGGSAEFTAPFDIDDIVIKDGSTIIWSENFDSIDAGKLGAGFGFKSNGLNGNTGYATLCANKNAGASYEIEEADVYYTKSADNGLISYTGEDIRLEPGVYTVAGTFRNGAYIATAAEIQWNAGAANGPYTVFEGGKIIDNNYTTVYAKVNTADGVHVGQTGATEITTAWTDYGFSFKVEKATVLKDITFVAEHAVDGQNVDLDYKGIALLRRDAHDNGDRPTPGVVMMLLLKMKESGRVKTTKNDYVEVINNQTKGFEYTIWRDAKKTIDLGTYTVSVKLRGHTGAEKLKMRIRNEYIELTPENGTPSATVNLTTDFVTYTGTFEIKEESYKNEGAAYHVWITLDNASGGGVSYDIDDLSFVRNGKEYIVDGLKRKDTNHEDSYVKRSGWATNDPGCAYGIATEEVSKKTGETAEGEKISRVAVANLVNEKGIEYTLWRDANNPIELGSYTLTLKLRGYTGAEKLRIRFRNALVTMKNEAAGVAASPLSLTTDYTTFTATVSIPEVSYNGNGKDYHVWISLDNLTGSAASFEIGGISLTRNGVEYIEEGLRSVNEPHNDKYVEKSGWWSNNCSFSRVN